MTDNISRLEKALESERDNAREWKRRSKWNKAEADKLRGQLTTARAELHQSEHKRRGLEADLARLIKASRAQAVLDNEDAEQREAILALGAMQGENITVKYPGKLVEDSEGRPLAVTPNHSKDAISAGVTITRAEATRYRIPEGAPGVRIIDIEGDQK